MAMKQSTEKFLLEFFVIKRPDIKSQGPISMIKYLGDDFNALAFMGYVYENEETRMQIQIAQNESV
jgi:hypothetical protein